MRNPLKRIVTVFIVITLLPVGFILYELNSLTGNEKIIREIYQNQLDAILYSVNQYSDDVISSWAHQVNMAVMEEKSMSDSITGIPAVMNRFGAIRYIYFNDLKNGSALFNPRSDTTQNGFVKRTLDSMVRENQDRVQRLVAYEKSGFQKMELIDTLHTDKPIPVFFVLKESTPKYRLCAMVIDLPAFIENTLGPKMQSISQDKFIIAAFRSGTDALVYSTAAIDLTPAMSAGHGSQKKSFWLLPGYYLSISLTGATINDLIKERMTTSLIILALLVTLLGFGIWFLYRNIRREMYLAEAKSEFVSNVSHEIRTPLALISMYAETLEMNRITEEKKQEYHSVIAKETARLSGIVNRILNFSQIQANKKTYESKPVQLNDLVSEVMTSYFFHLKDKGFTWEIVKDSTVKSIWGDRDSITEAFINLIDNAMKYSSEKKHITIKTGSEGQSSFIEVKDEGIGIPKKHHEEIFDQFYRAPTGDVHNTKGSGLGLTLVKRTVEAHHGKVKVESSPGKGSTFRLYFPIKSEKTL